MNTVLVSLYLVICAAIVALVPLMVMPYVEDYGVVTVFDSAQSVLLCTALASVAGIYAYKQGMNGPFLFKLFLAALMVRMLVGTVIFVFRGQDFFGGDAITYDFYGFAQWNGWAGDRYWQAVANRFVRSGAAGGWGMVYLVAAIYGIVGQNMLAVQLVNSVFGAATGVLVFLCALHVFDNLRVARLAALAVAFYPSLVLWSSQGLKDGPIVFFLTLSILATLKLGDKLSLKYIVILTCSLLSLLSLRFYVFYMICVAIGGAFIIGLRSITTTSFLRQLAAFCVLGLALTYVGFTRSASIQLERFGNLEAVQRSRQDAARSADSGFGKDIDVSSASGALSTIPIGLVYLLFAPFPWQVISLRQSITLPEMIVWWASFPMLILGLWFSIRYRLRLMSPILIFTAMLSLGYSVFQGNVGTAYRQRAQLLVFYFIFVAVGYVLMLEKREAKRKRDLAEREAVAARVPVSALSRR
ncbi:MAG: glycosyltransferase family 39 protein [Pyrinomonadaceae bacterium]|nr:glycosyltransferase family 39 protein [Pyrinomonadaceae bacterium]